MSLRAELGATAEGTRARPTDRIARNRPARAEAAKGARERPTTGIAPNHPRHSNRPKSTTRAQMRQKSLKIAQKSPGRRRRRPKPCPAPTGRPAEPKIALSGNPGSNSSLLRLSPSQQRCPAPSTAARIRPGRNQSRKPAGCQAPCAPCSRPNSHETVNGHNFLSQAFQMLVVFYPKLSYDSDEILFPYAKSILCLDN